MVTFLAFICCCWCTPSHEKWLQKIETNRKRRAGMSWKDEEIDENITCCGLWPSAKKPASQAEVDQVKAALTGKNN
jgi:hypothetical protein